MSRQTDMTEVELTISPEKAFFILMKAREFDAKVEQTDPDAGSNPTDDHSVDVLEENTDDSTEQELFFAVDALNEDEQADLLALTWMGRGDFTAAECSEARQAAMDVSDKHVAQYLIETPLVSDFLEEGLSMIGYDGEDVKLDHL